MRDPHVERLYYRVSSDEHISYDDPRPVVFTNHLGDFALRDGVLVVTPAAHYDEERRARATVEPFLRAWEIHTDLTSNIGAIHFSFEKAAIVDRDPPPPGSPQVFAVGVAEAIALAHQATVHLRCGAYPQPPQSFLLNPDVESAYARWIGHMKGKEPLQAMAYFVLTLLEASAGGRGEAANAYAIERSVLDMIGHLTSKKGDAATARKAPRSGPMQPLSESERHWLEQAIRRLIGRLGESTSVASPPQIRMVDLPAL